MKQTFANHLPNAQRRLRHGRVAKLGDRATPAEEARPKGNLLGPHHVETFNRANKDHVAALYPDATLVTK